MNQTTTIHFEPVSTIVAGMPAVLVDATLPNINRIIAQMRAHPQYQGKLVGEYLSKDDIHTIRVYSRYDEPINVGAQIKHHYPDAPLYQTDVAEFSVTEDRLKNILANKEKWALCIDADLFDDAATAAPPRVSFLNTLNPHLRSRATCEKEFQFLQPILYGTITAKDTGRFFSYSRAITSGESRLHGKHSIGIGGHIDVLPKGDFVGMMADEALREFDEEVGLKTTKQLRNQLISKLESGQFSYIRNKHIEVDAVHLGFAMVVEVERESDLTRIEASEIQSPKWLTLQECKQYAAEGFFESWSVIFTDILSK